MNISTLMPRFGQTESDELTDEELAQLEADEKIARHERRPKTGPATFGFQTSGQARRQAARRAASAKRKANQRHRRNWMKGQLGIAVLRGQLEVIVSDTASPALKQNAMVGMIAAHGSVQKASDAYVVAMRA